MKKFLTLFIIISVGFIRPSKVTSVDSFLENLHCIGAGCVSTTAVFPDPDAQSSAYPSPLDVNEQAAIYCPGPPFVRGTDESYSIVTGGDYHVELGNGVEVEGRIAVGGNFVVNTTGYGICQSGAGSMVYGDGGDTPAIAVEGTVSGTGSVGVGFNKQGVYQIRSGGANTLANSGGGSTQQTNLANQGTSGVDVAGIISGMQTVSANMCAAAPTGTFNGTTFSGSNAELEVFTVANSAITGAILDFENIAPGSTVIINVVGTGTQVIGWTAVLGRNQDPLSTEQDANVFNTIFNFCEASDVIISSDTQFNGTSLVPHGNLTLNDGYNGRLIISGNLTHQAPARGVRNYPYAGNLGNFGQLPVTLISFNAFYSDPIVNLRWETSSETVFDNFTIEHSLDARNWQKIGKVVVDGGNVDGASYSFDHKIDVQPGGHYYRLKMIDLDGTFKYSSIRYVGIERGSRLVLQPNPAVSSFQIKGFDISDEGSVKVRVYSKDGKLLREFTRQSAHDITFPISQSWPKEVLLVTIYQADNKPKTFRLVNE